MSNPRDACVARLDPQREAHLAAVRDRASIEVVRTGDSIWLRGSKDDIEHAHMSTGARFFEVLPQSAGSAAVVVAPSGRRAPTHVLPAVGWRRLSFDFRVQAPAAVMRRELQVSEIGKSEIRIARGGAPQPPAGPIVRTRALLEWALAAREIRFRELVFAASGRGDAIVVGQPLPPLVGQILCGEGCALVAAGYRLVPAPDDDTMSEVFEIDRAAGDRLVFTSSDVVLLRAAHWVRLSRSALRATIRATDR